MVVDGHFLVHSSDPSRPVVNRTAELAALLVHDALELGLVDVAGPPLP
ncbi:hypothetical protein OG535_39965 [Kitasatospora sp. NBC_00085]